MPRINWGDPLRPCNDKPIFTWFVGFFSDVDGGYSNWEKWTPCEGSCGMGKKVRERTCTNPMPQGKGKDCRGLGKSTERVPCDTGKKCPSKSRLHYLLVCSMMAMMLKSSTVMIKVAFLPMVLFLYNWSAGATRLRFCPFVNSSLKEKKV